MSEAAVAARARRRDLEWEAVEWEELRQGGEVRALLALLRSAIGESSAPAPLTLTLSRRERESSGDADESPDGSALSLREGGWSSDAGDTAGGGSLSLRERVGVRGERAVEKFASAVGAGSTEEMINAARALAGLGEGSTPAGDDFLVGAMYALRWLLPEARASRLCEAIVAAAAPRTTRLSAQWLHRAAGGEAIPTWSFFFFALAAGEPARIRASARGVLALGHTSGRAALAGFIATAEALRGDSR